MAIFLLLLIGTAQQIGIEQPFHIEPANAAGEKWVLQTRGKDYEIWRDDNFKGVGGRFRMIGAPEWLYDQVNKQWVPYIIQNLGKEGYKIRTATIGAHIFGYQTRWYDPDMVQIRVIEEKWVVVGDGQTLLEPSGGTMPTYTLRTKRDRITIIQLFQNQQGTLNITYIFAVGKPAESIVAFIGKKDYKLLELREQWNGVTATSYQTSRDGVIFYNGKNPMITQTTSDTLFGSVTITKKTSPYNCIFTFSKPKARSIFIDPDTFYIMEYNSGYMTSKVWYPGNFTDAADWVPDKFYDTVNHTGVLHSIQGSSGSVSASKRGQWGQYGQTLGPYVEQPTSGTMPDGSTWEYVGNFLGKTDILKVTFADPYYGVAYVQDLYMRNGYTGWKPYYEVRRGLMSFDTSMLPNNAVIEEARLRVNYNNATDRWNYTGTASSFGVTFYSAGGRSSWIDIESPSNTKLIWDSCPFSVGSLLATATDGWKEYTVDPSYIKRDGQTQFKMITNNERNNTGWEQTATDQLYYRDYMVNDYAYHEYYYPYTWHWASQYTPWGNMSLNYAQFILSNGPSTMYEGFEFDLDDLQLVITWIDPMYVITQYVTVTTTWYAIDHKPNVEQVKVTNPSATFGYRGYTYSYRADLPVICAEKNYYNFRVIVSNPDGAQYIQDVSVTLDIGNEYLNVKWTKATNTFTEEYDPYNYMTLNTDMSSSTQSGNQYILNFYIMFRWTYPEGPGTVPSIRVRATNTFGFESIMYFDQVYMLTQALYVKNFAKWPAAPQSSALSYISGQLSYVWAENVAPPTGNYSVRIYRRLSDLSWAMVFKGKQDTCISGAFNITITSEALPCNTTYLLYHAWYQIGMMEYINYPYYYSYSFYIITGKMPVEIYWKTPNTATPPGSSKNVEFKVRFTFNASDYTNSHGKVYINGTAATYTGGKWRVTYSRSDIGNFSYVVNFVYNQPSNSYGTISDLVGGSWVAWTRLKITPLIEGMANVYYILPSESVQIRLKVSYQHNNAPISNSKVEIVYNGAIQQTGYTDVNGTVTFAQAAMNNDNFQFTYKAYDPAGGYGLNTESVSGKKFFVNWLVISNWDTTGDTGYGLLKYTMKSKLGVTSYNWGYIFVTETGAKNMTLTINDIQGNIRVYQLYVDSSRLNYNTLFTATLRVQNIGTVGIQPTIITANIIAHYKLGYYVDQWAFPIGYLPPASEINATYVGQFGKNSTNALPERQYPLKVKFSCPDESYKFTTKEYDLPLLISGDTVYVKQYLNIFEDASIQRSLDWYNVQATATSKFYLSLVDENLLVIYPQYKVANDLPIGSQIIVSVTIFPSTVESSIQVTATIFISNNQTKPVYLYTIIEGDGIYHQFAQIIVASNVTLTYQWYAPAADVYTAATKYVTAKIYSKTGSLMNDDTGSYMVYNVPPTIVIVSPEQTELLIGNLTIDLNIYDASGIKTAMYRWNDEPQWLILQSPYDILIDTNRFENGRNFLHVKAIDGAGNPAETTFYYVMGNPTPEAAWVLAVRYAIALFAQLGFFPVLLLAFLMVLAGVYLGYVFAKKPQPPQAVVIPKGRRQVVTTTKYELALPKSRQELLERVKKQTSEENII
jgi:uncharacterized membrane protein